MVTKITPNGPTLPRAFVLEVQGPPAFKIAELTVVPAAAAAPTSGTLDTSSTRGAIFARTEEYAQLEAKHEGFVAGSQFKLTVTYTVKNPGSGGNQLSVREISCGRLTMVKNAS
ncbi:MAG TPA: hypothetical protein VGK73_11910 [Polyangiaceae bacterium]